VKPIVIDLFCGAGGASAGYASAGFDVIGVDVEPQPRYPYEFIQDDWESPLWVLPGLFEREDRFYLIHASPPCQRYAPMTKSWRREDEHPDLIAKVRERLSEIDAPYIIENVPGAPLIEPTTLCGSMFGLGAMGRQLRRHREFETNFDLSQPRPCDHQGYALEVHGHSGGRSRRDRRPFANVGAWREGMGIDWMLGREIVEAIPPAFTKWVGESLLRKAGEA
jgi:DNA (cytosine-5)-methyltransferase 1